MGDYVDWNIVNHGTGYINVSRICPGCGGQVLLTLTYDEAAAWMRHEQPDSISRQTWRLLHEGRHLTCIR